MKPLYKYSVGALVLAAAGLTVWSAAAGRLAVSEVVEQASSPAAEAAPPRSAGVAAAAAAAEPAGAGEASEAEAEAEAQETAVAETPVPLPRDLQVTVRRTKTASVVSVRRQGYLVAVRQGRERSVAMSKVEQTVKEGDAAPLVWETTHAKTLETVRGRLAMTEDGKVAAEGAAVPSEVASESTGAHACRGHGDGAGGFVVLCRISGAAAAAAVEGDDPRRGVWSQAGAGTLVRFDLPMEGDGVDTRVVGYEKGGKGTIVRVEASRAPGESAAVLAIGSDSRSQPRPVRRRIGCFCVLPANTL